MKQFLKKIKLIRSFSVGIPLDKPDLIYLLKKNIDVKSDTVFAAITERFTASKNKYVGEIDNRGFQIRKRKKFFSTNKNSSIITGVFREKDNKLYLETEVKGFTLIKTTLYICAVFFCLYFIAFKFVEKPGEPLLSIISALLLQALLLFGVPYLVIKSRIKRIQLELEQDIFDWILKW